MKQNMESTISDLESKINISKRSVERNIKLLKEVGLVIRIVEKKNGVSVIICHGGFGTFRESMYFGVPMIVFPFGVDQPGNAAGVEYLKAGIRGDVRSVNEYQIGKMLKKCLKTVHTVIMFYRFPKR